MQSHLDLSPNDTHVQIKESNATAYLNNQSLNYIWTFDTYSPIFIILNTSSILKYFTKVVSYFYLFLLQGLHFEDSGVKYN